MTFPVPAPTAELVHAFVEVTHEALKRAETAEAELTEERKLAAALGLDNRALKDRLRERDETIARQDRTQADSDRLVKRLRDTDAPARFDERDHTGGSRPCWCGMIHSPWHAAALNASRDRIEANK